MNNEGAIAAAQALDAVRLDFNETAVMVLNGVIFIIMFGVALDLQLSDFTSTFKNGWRSALIKGPFVGLFAQFLLLPAASSALVYYLAASPSIGLGMILVACCPGGTLSNYLTVVARGNAALSVSMTTISTMGSLILTPVNFMFWGRLNPVTSPVLKAIELDLLQVAFTVFIMLGLPVTLGMIVRAYLPKLAMRLMKPIRIFSMVFLFIFIAAAFAANVEHILAFVNKIFVAVAVQCFVAFAVGFGLAWLLRMEDSDARAVGMEVGCQNSSLGLVLALSFFPTLGGIAFVAAWWGVWGTAMATVIALIASRIKPTDGPSLTEAAP